MQQFAVLLNKPADVQYFSTLSAKVGVAFNTAFFNKTSFKYDNNTVTANLLPLYFGIKPQADRKQVFNNIVQKILNDDKGHISTGVIGTQWLMRGLNDHGRPDIAYRIAANNDYPSWGYMAEHGATTIWELWNGDTANPAMNSHNHIMLLGDLITWFYQDLAGIKTAGAGFGTIEMKPQLVAGLNHVKAAYRSPYGQIKSEWSNDEKQFAWNITVPANSKALVYIPAKTLKSITESGGDIASAEGIKQLKPVGDRIVLEIGSGDYQFKVKH
jgi:alpha-L-rhamnosidase